LAEQRPPEPCLQFAAPFGLLRLLFQGIYKVNNVDVGDFI
jgi:hypothetical protein